ncbi:MAG: cytochrome c biogenesis CcdA family protein [Xanthobacteraceae bacterium]
MFADLGGLALSFGAGALSTLNPCVLPLLPIVLFGIVEKHAWAPVALAVGLSGSFVAIGIFVALLGFSIGIDPGTLRLAVGALMVVFGGILLFPALQSRWALAAAPIAAGGQSLIDRLQPSGLGGQFALGALLGAVWSPCSGPTLGAAVGLAAQSETALKAALIMAVFGLGAATPVLALAYGSRQAIMARRDWLSRLSQIAKPLMGATLLVLGALVLTGLDKTIEAALTAAMPDWLIALTTRL